MSSEPSDAGQCPDSAAADGELIDAARREVEALATGAAAGAYPTREAAPAGGTPESVTLDSPTGRGTFTAPPPESFAGYQILKELHRGGQGVVYQALQKSTKRKVAIKVMKEGPFASSGDRARFEREVQVLGQLNHPNIVAIHDSGVTADTGVGRYHYFVMDYISGQPLDVYMASGERSIADTLKLFGKVCEAVNAAHLRGIIHRDLKPGNIRVDANGEPHILDFGLAKVASGAGEVSLMTMTGQFVGSLPWASPEQAEGVPTKIDIRTDVYSLGVILYQMLTGKFPYEVIGNMRDVLDRIMKAEPAKPSTLRRQINDEIETIVLKCLSKERERRYQTAGELARDIGHYLEGEPVEAKRDSALYVLRKQMRRYKLPVAVAAAFVLLLAGFGIAMSVTAARNAELAARERAAKSDALAERSRADERATDALKARDQAEWRTYVANITAADAAMRVNEVANMRRRLDAAPQRFRNWEWRYLHARLDRSLATLLRGTPQPDDSDHSDTGHATTPGGTNSTRSVLFSPDGTRIVTGSCDNTARIWDTATGNELATLRGHRGPVVSVAFSSSGTRIVTASDDTTARIWDVNTHRELASLRGHTGPVVSVSFSPHGTLIVTASDDGTARIWDAVTGSEVATLRGHTFPLLYACFSPDGTRVVTAQGNDGVARIWDASTGRELMRIGHAGHFFQFSPDGASFLTGGDNGTARICDAATGNELATLRGHEATIGNASLSADGRRVATTSWDHTARVWDAVTGVCLLTLRGHTARVRCASFSRDGTRIVTASDDTTARIWDAATGNELVTLRGHTGWVSSASFSRDGTRIVTGADDGTARIWDAATDSEAMTLAHGGLVEYVSFSPDGARILTSAWGKAPRLWDMATGTILATLHEHITSEFVVAWLSPDGTKVLTWGDGDYIGRICDAATGIELAVLDGVVYPAALVPFSADGTRIVTGYRDENTYRIWDAATGEGLATLHGCSGAFGSVSFSPDGTRIVTGCRDNTARIWDAATGSELAMLRGHMGRVYYASFSPDGTRIVTQSDDHTARIWSVASANESVTLPWPRDWLSTAAFSPDGRRVVGAWDDYTARIWDAASGSELATLRGHTAMIRSARFSPDGTQIVTASSDYTARVWDAATGEDLVTLRGHKDQVIVAAFSPDGSQIVTGSQDGTAAIWDTVSYADRYRRRQALNAGQRRAVPLIDALYARLADWAKVTEAVRADGSLSAEERRAALDTVLTRASAESEGAARAIHEAQKEFILSAAVVKHLVADTTLEPGVRKQAIERARRGRDIPELLNVAAWEIVSDPNAGAERYGLALQAAQTAVHQQPRDGNFLNTLGVALYRVGRYEEALETLRRSNELNREPETRPGQSAESAPASQTATESPTQLAAGDLGSAADAAFIAMSLHKLGRTAEAHAALERLREWVAQPRSLRGDEHDFLREAEALILGEPTTRPDRQDGGAGAPESQPGEGPGR